MKAEAGSGVVLDNAIGEAQGRLNRAMQDMAGPTAKLEMGKPYSLGVLEDSQTLSCLVLWQRQSDKATPATRQPQPVNRVRDKVLFECCRSTRKCSMNRWPIPEKFSALPSCIQRTHWSWRIIYE
jgi:hypothetical protein